MHQLEPTDFKPQITEVNGVPGEPTIPRKGFSQVTGIWARVKSTVLAVMSGGGGSDEVMGIKSLEESVKNLAMKIRAIPSPWSDSHERNTVVVSGNIIIFNGVLKIVGTYFRGKGGKKGRVLYDLYDIHEKGTNPEHALSTQQTKTEIINALCEMLNIPSILAKKSLAIADPLLSESSPAMLSTQFTTPGDTVHSHAFYYHNWDSQRVVYMRGILPQLLDHAIFEDVRTIFRAHIPDHIREAEKIHRSSYFRATFDQLPGQESGLQIVDIAVILEGLLSVISNAQIQPELLVETIERYTLIRYLFPDETYHASEKYLNRDIIDIDTDVQGSLESVSTTLSKHQKDIEAQIRALTHTAGTSKQLETIIDPWELREELQRELDRLESIVSEHCLDMINMLTQLKTTEYTLRQSIVRERQFRESLGPDDLHHCSQIINSVSVSGYHNFQ